MTDEEDAIWHVIIDGAQHGPLTKAQVLGLLTGGKLVGGNLIWRPGLSDWKSVSEIDEFRQPPSQMTAGAKVPASRPQTLSDQPLRSDQLLVGEKWSLWKSASIGLLVSALILLVQVANGGGFELANYAHTGSTETIAALIGQILAAPLIFVLAAAVRNVRRPSRSSASTVKGALTFGALLAGVFVALFVYGETVFSSTEAISGEARKQFIAGASRTCIQRQRSLSQVVTDAQINAYCTCVSEKIADSTTYKQLGTEPDASVLADLRQKTAAVSNACR